MNIWRLALRTLLRSLRAGRVTILLTALIVAVAALTSVGFFIDRVRVAVEREAAGILAADLRLSASTALNQAYLREAGSRGLLTAEVVSFPTVVVAGEASQLTSLYAVSEGYPLRGQMQIADSLAGDAYAARRGPASGEVFAEAALLARLDVRPGQRINVGAHEVTITRVLRHRPDQSMGFENFAPAMLLHIDDLDATDLLRPGSRVRWAQLFAGPGSEIREFRQWLDEVTQPGERLRTPGRTEARISSAIERARSYLSLASLIAVLLAATAVAISARHYAASQIDSVALMKCLGATQSTVVGATVVELGLLGLIAGVVGGILGYVAQLGIVGLVGDLMQVELPAPGLWPALGGIVTALAVLTGFALPTMLTLKSVPPLRVLRHDAAPEPVSAGISYGAAVATVFGLLILFVGADELLFFSVLGLSGGAVLLAAAAWLLVRLVGRLRHRAGVAWRYGLANIARRRGDSVAQVMAFGFGLTVLLLLSLVRTELLETWYTSLPVDTPNNFIINIQPHERDGILAAFEEFGHDPPRLTPLVRARLTEVNGRELGRLRGDGGWLTRSANLTWAETLDSSNDVIAGKWWAPGDGRPQVSIEEEVAQGLGLALGDQISFDVAGLPLTAELTSIRRVNWDSFRPNFFLVFNPTALEGYPATFLSAVHSTERDVFLAIAKRFPGISVLDLDSLLAQIRGVMDRAALAVEYVFSFTLLAGIVVLLAAVQATREERRFEVALLRTLGASRRQVFAGLVTEFVSLGVLAGFLAALISSGVGFLLATQVFNLDFNPAPGSLLAGVLVGAILVGVSGILATRSVVSQPPVRTLRAQ